MSVERVDAGQASWWPSFYSVSGSNRNNKSGNIQAKECHIQVTAFIHPDLAPSQPQGSYKPSQRTERSRGVWLHRAFYTQPGRTCRSTHSPWNEVWAVMWFGVLRNRKSEWRHVVFADFHSSKRGLRCTRIPDRSLVNGLTRFTRDLRETSFP